MRVCTASVVAILTVAAVLFLQYNGITDGTAPTLHMGQPYGLEADAVPDMRGKIAVVTGASSGLGMGVARVMASKGARLVITARDSVKCEQALSELRGNAAGDDTSCIVLELLSLEHTAAAALELALTLPRVDWLVANAGIMAPPELLLSPDGIEQQFATNQCVRCLPCTLHCQNHLQLH